MAKTKKQKLRSECDKLWKQIILERHDYQCELCGGGWKITAHHYYFRSSAGHLVQELENGICLCAKCHFTLHRRGADQKYIEDKIIDIRGKEWLNRLKKKKEDKPSSSYKTVEYYNNIIKKLKDV